MLTPSDRPGLTVNLAATPYRQTGTVRRGQHQIFDKEKK